ncbi:flavin reductase family protein [Danxiaibacter flavus]|uniref:Flavin reductase family protein n=1 Tax=Danxiaibacter flavus TaxID=3049108 RepID=A0ABV3Z7M3_9BACT|nr:flavin reductase family protein [Chitinophagaceae bacterium DXS]
MHNVSFPSILYFGTPVILITTVNEDESFNIAPISSVFWLGWRCMIGIAASSKTTENLLRTKECVINLPSENEVDKVNRLALKTGSSPVPASKKAKGYQYEPDKFGAAGFTSLPSSTVNAPRILECPVHLEAGVVAKHFLSKDEPLQYGNIICFELKILQVHLDESIVDDDKPDHIDPDKWRPLIMSFQKFYGLGSQLHHSTLSEIPEKLYNTVDRKNALEMIQ